MKKIFLCLMLMTSSYSFACSCLGANFSREDVDTKVSEFVDQKLNIALNDITSLSRISSEHFLSKVGKTFLTLFTIGEPDYVKSCEFGCAMSVNEKSIYQLEFQTKDKLCKQMINVKMMSNLLDSGYSSKVKTKKKAVCKSL